MPEMFVDSVLRRRWDDAASTYYEWDADGVLVVERPFTDVEAGLAAARSSRSAREVASAAMVSAAAAAVPTNAAFLALDEPTTAQVAAQVRSLTLQAQALGLVAAATLNLDGGT